MLFEYTQTFTPASPYNFLAFLIAICVVGILVCAIIIAVKAYTISNFIKHMPKLPPKPPEPPFKTGIDSNEPKKMTHSKKEKAQESELKDKPYEMTEVKPLPPSPRPEEFKSIKSEELEESVDETVAEKTLEKCVAGEQANSDFIRPNRLKHRAPIILPKSDRSSKTMSSSTTVREAKTPEETVKTPEESVVETVEELKKEKKKKANKEKSNKVKDEIEVRDDVVKIEIPDVDPNIFAIESDIDTQVLD